MLSESKFFFKYEAPPFSPNVIQLLRALTPHLCSPKNCAIKCTIWATGNSYETPIQFKFFTSPPSV